MSFCTTCNMAFQMAVGQGSLEYTDNILQHVIPSHPLSEPYCHRIFICLPLTAISVLSCILLEWPFLPKRVKQTGLEGK